MRPALGKFFWPCCLLAAGCAHPTAPVSPLAADEAAETARRAERLKVMQEYWEDRTGAAGTARSRGRAPSAPLEYPAGVYGGINFAPRLAPDSSLGEPIR